MLTKNNWPYLAIIVLMAAFLSAGWVKSCSAERSLKKVNEELSGLRAEKDELVVENSKMIGENETMLAAMDSLMKKSNVTHEKEIHNHWNTVYNGLIVSDTAYRFISEYLYDLGHQ